MAKVIQLVSFNNTLFAVGSDGSLWMAYTNNFGQIHEAGTELWDEISTPNFDDLTPLDGSDD